MNVVNLGVVPAPLPAPLPVQRPASAQASPDAGARNAQEHSPRPPKKTEPEPVKLPPLKPVSTDEFRVMLGALPVSVLSATTRDLGRAVDVYA